MIYLHVNLVFTAAVAGGVRETQLIGGVQGSRALKSHIRTTLTKVCDETGKKKSSRMKES